MPPLDIEREIASQFHEMSLAARVRPGQSVAVAVGSRGIAQLPRLVAGVVAVLAGLGLRPFIIPAMGSHGGASAEGQVAVLAGLGISEKTLGVPVRASMATLSLGELPGGGRAFLAEDALAADHLVLVSRVKPHTLFRAPVESGLCKMLAVGLGRQRGAEAVHLAGLAEGIVAAARQILARAPLLCGVAVVEAAAGGLAALRVVAPGDFEATDRELLALAWRHYPRLPIADLDVLVVEEMGKNISGGGMDLNVTGFWRRDGGPREPDYRTVVALRLTPESHGNASGIGWADLVTRQLAEQIDWTATRQNAVTSRVLRAARLPLAAADDREAFGIALKMGWGPAGLRLARIKSTLELGEFWVSPVVAAELGGRPDLAVDPTARALAFDQDGRLLPA